MILKVDEDEGGAVGKDGEDDDGSGLEFPAKTLIPEAEGVFLQLIPAPKPILEFEPRSKNTTYPTRSVSPIIVGPGDSLYDIPFYCLFFILLVH